MGTNSSNPFMAEAIALSLQNVRSGNGGPFAAVIVKGGQIIARGVNRVTATNDPTAHAEVVAIREACTTLKTFQLTGCEIYTSCEPCPMCLAAIYWARPDRVYFGNTKEDAADAGFDDSFIYDEIEKPVNGRKIPLQQLMRGEAIRAFEEWAKSPNKVEY
ncbi:MAG: tRNA-specific adenosine deaminase [Acidobacteriales bacterium]|nr:tRNA-specific adenosine deaminase [Terriglobales bacterium]